MKTYSSPPHILFLHVCLVVHIKSSIQQIQALSPEPLPRAASWRESVSSWMKNDLFLFSSFLPRSHDNHSTVGSFGCCRTARYPEYTRVLCRRECHEWGRHRSINVQSDWRTESKVRNLLEFNLTFLCNQARFFLCFFHPHSACNGNEKTARISLFAMRAGRSNVMMNLNRVLRIIEVNLIWDFSPLIMPISDEINRRWKALVEWRT